jgi:urea transport system permease protein
VTSILVHYRSIFSLLFAAALILLSLDVASAQDATAPDPAAPAAALPTTPEALIAELPAADFDRKSAIAAALAMTGHPRAGDIINALVSGNLNGTADGRIVIESGDATKTYTDALSGAPATGLATHQLTRIGVNNRLRRELRGLYARLTLLSSDARIRAQSAQAAFTAKDADSLPAIEEAIGKETIPAIKAALEQARAAIVIGDASAPELDKLAAINVISARGDQEALSLLSSLRNAESPTVREAAVDAATAIESALVYWSGLQNVYYGLSLGSVLLLAAIGLAVTFGVMGVINMAHGEMMMLGAYTTYVVQQVLISSAPGLMEWSLLVAIPSAFLVSAAAGVAIERGIIRFLYGRPLETLLATWGLSLIIQQGVRTIFGPTNKAVITPQWMSGSFTLGHLQITYVRLYIIVFALIAFSLLIAFLRRTYSGMQMRAVTQNRRMASAMGVRTSFIDAFTFALGSGVAGIAGVALSQIDNVSPNLGQTYIIDSFMVVVFGGVGNLWGTLVGAMTLGVANKFLEPYAGAVVGKILVLVFIILFIQRRPRGLFALKGRAVET